jgi:hypothetical protein
MMMIKPGMVIEFMYYSDYVKENVHILRAVIFDVIGKKIILSQASPTVLKSGLKKEIMVTYLDKSENRGLRLGFLATITDLLEKYEIGSGDKVAAIAIEQETLPQPINIRMQYRLKVPSASDFTLYIRDRKVNISDISIGGVKISLAGEVSFKSHDRIRLRLGFNNRGFDLDAEVLRIQSLEITRGGDSVHIVSLKFVNANKEFEHMLGKQIFSVERRLLAEGKIRSDN